ncbi:AlpA family phage regulatory protein, partial [Escherichia coli]|nr:AlpA family phage regulatory protein [Escherichia coli]
MSQSFIRLSEVQRRTGYSKAWIYRLIKEQRFPQSEPPRKSWRLNSL